MTRKPGRPGKGEGMSPEAKLTAERLWLQGATLVEIAAAVGGEWTKEAVAYHLKTAKRRWAEMARAHAWREVAKIELVERIAWEAWSRSRKDGKELTIKEAERELENGKVEMKVIERATKRIKRDGSATWLTIVQWCIESRCKMFGWWEGKAFAKRDGDETPDDPVESLTRQIDEWRAQHGGTGDGVGGSGVEDGGPEADRGGGEADGASRQPLPPAP